MSEIDHSLRRLGTDYVDLYQIHRWDYNTPSKRRCEALHDVVKSGKARYTARRRCMRWQFAPGALRHARQSHSMGGRLPFR